MAQTAEELKPALARLSSGERAELALFLLSSLDDGEDADAEAAWDAELARRFEEIESGREPGEAVADVFARLREKYPFRRPASPVDAECDHLRDELISAGATLEEMLAELRQRRESDAGCPGDEAAGAPSTVRA